MVQEVVLEFCCFILASTKTVWAYSYVGSALVEVAPRKLACGALSSICSAAKV